MDIDLSKSSLILFRSQVYIPLFEQDHWFLVVIDLAAQVKYIVGSVAVNAQCEKRVLKLVSLYIALP